MTATQPSAPQAAVIDASAASKWLLRDEGQLAAADHLLHQVDAAALVLIAPQQIEVEVANAIRKAILNNRLTPEAGEEALRLWLGPYLGRLRLAPNALLLPLALRRAIALGITLFDALYVVLAEREGALLITGDQRLLRSPAAALPFVRSLSSFGPAS